MTPAQATAAYFDARAAGYRAASGRAPWRWVRESEWRAVERALRLSPGLSALDAGCGAGFYSERMRLRGASVAGVDASEAMLAAYRAAGFEGRLGRVEELPEGTRFDRVLLAGVLEFVAEPERAFRALPGLLAPGGRAVALVPRGGAWGGLYLAAHALGGCPAFVRSDAEYEAWARRHGLALVESAPASFMSRVLSFEAA